MIKVPDFDLGLPILERIDRFVVVRDDLLEGGTKMRGLVRLFLEVDRSNYVYASPTFGAAQVALAMACHKFKKQAVIFVPMRAELSIYTRTARDYGADIRLVKMGFLSHCTAEARRFCQRTPDSILLPFGINHPAMVDGIADAAKRIDYHPSEVWSAVSSGTLTRSLQRAWPSAKFFGVSVGHKPTKDQRGSAVMFAAEEKFAQRAKHPPPFPSAINFDAKVWTFVQKHASEDALFWNVAK